MIGRRRFLQFAAASLAARGASAVPHQAWPARPVRIVAPFNPGTPVDVVARQLASYLAAAWGQPVVVDNRPGAGGNIGTELVARAAPDGYTILFASFGHGVNRYLYPRLAFDPERDFAPVTLVSVQPAVMIVPMSSPARSAAEFIAYARAASKPLTYGSAGNGTALHFCGELFKRMTRLDLTHVPYKAVPASTDLVAGRIDLLFPLLPTGLTLARSGKARALAVTSAARTPLAPDLPTLAESGLTGFDVSSWFGLFVPIKTPPQIVHTLHAAAGAALATPALREDLQKAGVMPVGSTPHELARHLRRELERWRPVIAEANIRADG